MNYIRVWHKTIGTGQTERPPSPKYWFWGKNISNGVSVELSFLADHLIVALHVLWTPGACSCIPATGLNSHWSFFILSWTLFVFWPPLYPMTVTSSAIITPWVRRWLLLVVLSLLGPLPWGGQEWTVIPSHWYRPRGISYTFCLLPPPSLSSSRSWDTSEPMVTPLLPSSKEVLKHLFSDGLSKRHWGLETFICVLHHDAKAVGFTSFSPCSCNRSKLSLPTFSVAFVILRSTVSPYPVHTQHT